MRKLFVFALLSLGLRSGAQTPDWSKVNDEAMRHFQALVQIDTTDPPGNETRVAEYVKKVLEAEGIPVTMAAKDPARANIIARLKGNGSKRPLLIMGHSDTVRVDPSKWTFPPFSATRQGGYVYGRGTLDDKSDLLAAMMTMLHAEARRNAARSRRDLRVGGRRGSLHRARHRVPGERALERDRRRVLPRRRRRRAAQERSSAYAMVETTEKQPKAARLVANGPAGHGSRPLRTNAIVHLSRSRGEDRGVGSAHAIQRHHALLLRKDGDGQQSRRGGAIQRAVRSAKAPAHPRISGRTRSRATTRCCTLRFRPTSSRAAIR